MGSALARRRAERRALIDAHLGRSDLVRYEDGMPRVVTTGAVIVDGKVVSPARTRVLALPVPGGTLRLVALSGLGDAFWTRGIVRETLKAGLRVLLDTPYE